MERLRSPDLRGTAREREFQETDSRAYLRSKTVQPMGGSSEVTPVNVNVTIGIQTFKRIEPFYLLVVLIKKVKIPKPLWFAFQDKLCSPHIRFAWFLRTSESIN